MSCWLQHLGLGEHAYAFAAHEIDLEVLTQLEEPDLLDVGVHDPTQRLRLLRGIEVLRARGSLSALGRPGERRGGRDESSPHGVAHAGAPHKGASGGWQEGCRRHPRFS